ncbi:SMI1/KNR4 family protein [Streptomyces buecherae]|uniref:SMI1/KNR4 family protein n=1 Tax=Streptomyces buecherae TaxID=2763006 RepID=UPI003678F9D5
MGGQRVEEAWGRLGSWARTNAPSAYADGVRVSPVEIEEAGRALGVPFPEELVVLSLCRGRGGLGRLPGGALMNPDEIVSRTLLMRDLLADAASDGEAHDDYWHHDYLFFADDDVNGLAMDCRPGDGFGAVGLFSEYSGVEFDRAPSLAAYLEELADSLETGSAFDGYVPIAFDGGLLWEPAGTEGEAPHPDPRSLLAVRAALARPAEQASAAAPARGPQPAPERRSPMPGAGAEQAGGVSAPLFGRQVVRPAPEPGAWQNTDGDGRARYTCLSFVHGIDEDELLRRYGALTEPPHRWTRPDVVAAVERRCLPAVRIGRAAGGWVFAAEEWQDPIEPSGYGMRVETLRRLSAGTRAVALQIADLGMHVFDDGDIVSEFGTNLLWREGRADLFESAKERSGLETHGLTTRVRLALLRGLLRRELGIVLADHALHGPLTAAHFLPLLHDPPAASSFGEGMGRLLADVPDQRLRSALTGQVRHLAERSGLAAYPEVGQALDDVGGGWTGPVDDESPLGLRLRTVRAETQAIQRIRSVGRRGDPDEPIALNRAEELAWWRREEAARALHALVLLPPRAAAPVVQHARHTPHWRADLLAEVAAVRSD